MQASPRPPHFRPRTRFTEGARDAQHEDRRRTSSVRDHFMLKFDWNALRIGDRVLVHDAESPQLTLLPGIVAVIDARKGAKRAGVRFTGSDDDRGIRCPSYTTMLVQMLTMYLPTGSRLNIS